MELVVPTGRWVLANDCEHHTVANVEELLKR
jgi:hypothetical protein